jgi:hypothetical protein
MTSSAIPSLVLVALATSVACGGSVVFEEPSEGGGGADVAVVVVGTSQGGASAQGGSSASAQGGEGPADVSVVAVATTGPGGGDGGAPPGPGPGPSQGGGDPTGGGFGGAPPPGPSGVGGADVGPTGAVAASSSSGCSSSVEATNQYCYARETCGAFQVELECETDGPGPWACWCYQNGDFIGACSEVDQPSCSTQGCCEALWAFPEG